MPGIIIGEPSTGFSSGDRTTIFPVGRVHASMYGTATAPATTAAAAVGTPVYPASVAPSRKGLAMDFFTSWTFIIIMAVLLVGLVGLLIFLQMSKKGE